MKIVDGTPILDEMPFEDIAHEDRTDEELREWWNVPFIIDGSVACLDGGAWDRATYKAWKDRDGDLIEAARKLKKATPEYRDYGSDYRRESIYSNMGAMIMVEGKPTPMTTEQALEIHAGFLPPELDN